MSVSQLDLWVREVMKGRERREGGREEKRGGVGDMSGCGPVCIPQTGLQSTLQEPPYRRLNQRPGPLQKRGHEVIVGTTLGAGRQVAAP